MKHVIKIALKPTLNKEDILFSEFLKRHSTNIPTETPCDHYDCHDTDCPAHYVQFKKRMMNYMESHFNGKEFASRKTRILLNHMYGSDRMFTKLLDRYNTKHHWSKNVLIDKEDFFNYVAKKDIVTYFSEQDMFRWITEYIADLEKEQHSAALDKAHKFISNPENLSKFANGYIQWINENGYFGPNSFTSDNVSDFIMKYADTFNVSENFDDDNLYDLFDEYLEDLECEDETSAWDDEDDDDTVDFTPASSDHEPVVLSLHELSTILGDALHQYSFTTFYENADGVHIEQAYDEYVSRLYDMMLKKAFGDIAHIKLDLRFLRISHTPLRTDDITVIEYDCSKQKCASDYTIIYKDFIHAINFVTLHISVAEFLMAINFEARPDIDELYQEYARFIVWFARNIRMIEDNFLAGDVPALVDVYNEMMKDIV